MKLLSAHNFGFTLVETMIVVMIMVILAGTSVAGIINFNQYQGTLDDAKLVATELRRAYSKATAVSYPMGVTCTGLTGWRVAVTTNSKDMTLTALCNEGNFDELRRGVLKVSHFTSTTSFTIKVPTGVLSPSQVDLVIRGDGNSTRTNTIRVKGYGVFEVI